MGVKGKPVRIRHGPATVSGLKAASQETCLSGNTRMRLRGQAGVERRLHMPGSGRFFRMAVLPVFLPPHCAGVFSVPYIKIRGNRIWTRNG